MNDWIRHAEAKTAATLAATGVSSGVLYNLAIGQHEPEIWLVIIEAGCGVALAIAALVALLALLPRLQLIRGKRSQQETSIKSLLYFENIAKHFGKNDGSSYSASLQALTGDSQLLTDDIARQAHANAQVARWKYGLANAAIIALGIALILLGTTAATVAVS
ncbi:Pycsar system effector family protein [Rathayibacter tritici]|uniref:Pycsar system effector family protein n=1 Tax=Rathayibacter tritici TaxID=33888 RepID=UPI00082C3BD5|nr:Pycsar system effector family protein [Rathayibacter tritici]